MQGVSPATLWIVASATLKVDQKVGARQTNKPITYELDHSDGFYVVSSSGRLRFVSGLSARFTGTLTKAFAAYLNDMGRQTLAKPGKGWTPSDAVAALSYIANKKL